MADTASLLQAAADLFDPFVQALQSRDALTRFLQQFGWTLGAGGTDAGLTATFDSFSTTVRTLERDATSGSSEEILASDVAAVVAALLRVGTTSTGRLPAPLNQSAFWSTFPADLLEFLIYEWVQRHAPAVFGVLRAIGTLDNVVENADPTTNRAAWTRHSLRIDRLGTALTNPSQLFTDVYGWGQQFKHQVFVDALAALLSGFRLEARVARLDRSLTAVLYDRSNASLLEVREVVATLVTKSIQSDFGGAIVKISVLAVPVPPKDDKTKPPVGFAIIPFFSGNVSTTIDIAKGAALALSGGLDTSIVRAEIRPDGATLAVVPAAVSLSAEAVLSLTRETPLVLVGAANSTRIEASAANLTLGFAMSASDSEFRVALSVQGLALIVAAPADDAFVGKAIGSSPGRIQLPSEISWSSKHGVLFGTSGQLDITVPLHVSLGGVLELTEVRIAGEPAQGDATQLLATVSGNLSLGPIEATIRRIGLRIRAASASPNHPGNLGVVDVGLALKPPDGVGLSVDAAVVTGGGFLSHDEQKHEYDGILVLEIEDALSVKAITILTTGANNFSMMALIFIEDFTPIQIGLGFSVDGLGGMVGINRQAEVAVLQAGLKTHLLDDILFPADPIKDAVRIIDNLKRAFPMAQGRILFGPMLQIGWGEPVPLIFAELGVLIELPAPIRILLLGRIDALVPKPEAPVVELHLDVLGVIDFGASSLALDASLHDSRVAAFAVAGDMALRLVWAGPGRTFLFAVGGFNKRFQPPPGFPQLARVSISLATGDNPRLRLEAYMALTSNTAQIGAHLELFLVAGDFQVVGELAFDALFQFQPFLFIIDIHAGIALLISGNPFMSLTLDGTLSGPTPWHVVGSASFHVLFFTVSVGVDVTIGQAAVEAALPPPPAHDRLVAALKATNSWSAQVSPAKSLVTLRKLQPNGQLLGHPLGTVAVHQQVVPLDLEIVRFGGVKLAQPHTFAIPHNTVKVNGTVAPGVDDIQDYFATAQFKDMSDDEKLSRPSFEPYDAGIRITSERPTVGTPRERDIVYEETVVDPAGTRSTRAAPMRPTDFVAHRSPSGIARIDRLGRRRFSGAARTIPVHDTRYVAATVDTLARQDIAGIGAGTTYTQALDALRRHTDVNTADRTRLQVVGSHEATR